VDGLHGGADGRTWRGAVAGGGEPSPGSTALALLSHTPKSLAGANRERAGFPVRGSFGKTRPGDRSARVEKPRRLGCTCAPCSVGRSLGRGCAAACERSSACRSGLPPWNCGCHKLEHQP